MTGIEAIGYAGTVASVPSHSKRMVVPLRNAGILGPVFFIACAMISGFGYLPS